MTFGVLTLWTLPNVLWPLYIIHAIDYISKWVHEITTNTKDSRVVVKFVHRNIFTRFETARAMISDECTHFCNTNFNSLLYKYNVKYKMEAFYHPKE